VTDICFPKLNDLLTAEQALANIRQAIRPITEYESIHLSNARGRILAETVRAPIDVPPERNAAMDGYAFSSKDIIPNQAFTLQMIGTSWAGKPYTGPLASKQCVRIFTGAVVPNCADSVIAQEQVKTEAKYITFSSDTQPFKNIRAIGSDVSQHDILLNPSQELNGCALGLLAAAGVETLSVFRQLKVGFFSTGDELVGLGETLRSGQIYDSNRYLLKSLLDDPKHAVTDLGVIKDDPQLLERLLMTGSKEFDVLISTGGASVGDADFVKSTLAKCGQVNFWKLAIKPGKPLAFGRINQCWFFGLPGNPVAVLVTYQQFVKLALLQLAGAQPSQPLRLRAICETALRKSPGRQEYQRGILRQISPGEFSVKLAGGQDSHQLKSASLANCFIVLDRECAGVEVGQIVTVEPFESRI